MKNILKRIAAWNSFVRDEANRQSIPGMARLYRRFLDAHPGAPLVYLSTGAWNTFEFLQRFLRRHAYPKGPLLLTDWGPTNAGWFRSGADHKRLALRELARDFPDIKWVLIGLTMVFYFIVSPFVVWPRIFNGEED